jgi:uncharacterized RDD family membrane protein YckC
MLDTLHRVQTPEAVDLELRVAGPVARSLAWGVDAILSVLIVVGAFVVLGALGTFGLGLALLVNFAVSWFYPVVFEVWARGQTPGKRTLGLRVLHEDGTPVGLRASLLRNFLRVVDFLPFLYLGGLVSMLLDGSFRRLGDLAAGTIVTYADAGRGRATAARVPDATPLAPPLPLDRAEQQAVIAFAERAVFLTAERAAELASIPAPLLGDGDARRRLERIAAWLVGRRP